MTRARYPAYQDSGTAWLGEVPASWAVERLKRGFDLIKRPILPTDGNVTAFRDGQVTLRSNRRVDGFTEADKEIGYQGVEPEDLVIHAMDAFAGAIGVSDSRGKSTPVYSVCRAQDGYLPRYYALTLRHIALSGYIASLGKGVRERSTDFRWNDAQNVLVPVPPLEEQVAILSFVDAQTEKVDLLIEKQERLTETLAEQRRAVISHAVTKGLDPNVPMRDSHIEWLGLVPRAWSVTQVKNGFDVTLGKMLDAGRAEKVGNAVLPYIRAANIQERGLDLAQVNEMAFTPAERVSLTLRASDLLVVEGGAVGVCARLVEDMPGWSFQKTVNRVRSKGTHSTAFLGYYIDAVRLGGVIEVLCNKSTIAHFTAEKLKALELALPPIEEQIEIVAHLDRETAQMDALSAKAREMIDVLKERRQALISAAVTGKIDVRRVS